MNKEIHKFLLAGTLTAFTILAGCNGWLPGNEPSPTNTAEPAATVTPSPTIDPTATKTVEPTSKPTEISNVYCNNRYWPIVQNAKWEFDDGQTWTISSVSGDTQNASFTVNGNDKYVCGPDGIFQILSEKIMFLFPMDQLSKGNKWSSEYVYVSVLEFTTITVPAGTFQAVGIRTEYGSGGMDDYFAIDVGPVQLSLGGDYGGGSNGFVSHLVSYSIPAMSAP